MRNDLSHKEIEQVVESQWQTGDAPLSSHPGRLTPPARVDHPQAEKNGCDSRAGVTERSAKRRLLTDTQVLIGWTLLAFLLRLFCLWRFEHVISPDGVDYVGLGRNLMAGNFREGVSANSQPLYPLLVGLSTLLFRDAEFAGRFVSVVAGSLLVVPAHRLMRRWYGARVARVGAGLVALHPLLIYYSTVLLTEATYTLLFTCGIVAGWSALKGRRARPYLLAGVAFGACFLLKPEAAGFFLLLLVLIACRKFLGRAYSFTLATRNAFMVAAGFMLLAAPYLFYLRQQTGRWTLSGKAGTHLWQGSRRAGGDFASVNLPPMPELTVLVVQLTKALRFEYEIFNLIFPPTFVLFAALGLFRHAWTRGRAQQEIYLCSFIAATLAGYAVTLPNIRFLVPLVPLLLCWVAGGMSEFGGWLSETCERLAGARRFSARWRVLSVSLVGIGLLASLLPLTVYLWRGDKWNDYHGQKRAGAWIKEHDASPAPVIMSTVPVAAFYANGRHVTFVDEDYAEFIARARREGVGHIIINGRDFRYMKLGTLLDERAAHPGLRLECQFSESGEHKILIYAPETVEQSATPQGKAP